MQSPNMVPDPSSTGLDPRVAGLLCYLGGLLTGILFLVLERRSRFVKFHAMQSICATVAVLVIDIVLGFIPIIGWLIGILLTPLTLILWIALMVLALKGRWFKLPVIGDFAEQQARDM